MDERYFKLAHVAAPAQKYKSLRKFNPGRYSGDPNAAAKKAFGSQCRTKKMKGVCTLVVTVKETTQGSDKKLYSYRMSREKLKKPVKVERGGVNVVYKYKTVVKPLNTNTADSKTSVGIGRSVKGIAKPTNVRKSLNKD